MPQYNSDDDRSGNGSLRSQHASTGLIERFINPIISRTTLHITRGDNQSFCRFPDVLGIEELRFTVPVFTKRVLMFNIEEYPNNITSSSIALSFVNASEDFPQGGIHIECQFEENGGEIGGTFQANLKNMSLGITIGLAVEKQQFSYDRVHVKLDFDLDIVGVPDMLLDSVFKYTDRLKQQIQQDLSAMISRPEIKVKVSQAATKKILTVLPAGASLHAVEVSHDTVIVKY